jgi:hypothetical protein
LTNKLAEQQSPGICPDEQPRQAYIAVIAAVPGYAPVELVVRQELGDLRQDDVSVIHRDSPPELIGGEYGTHTALQSSNRLNPFCYLKVGFSWTCTVGRNR